jgi:prepilin-type N-terminal cleavage/methylation domain-containing protein
MAPWNEVRALRRGEERAREAGFTLVELIVVIVILAVLLSLALPGYLSTRQKAYLTEAQQHLQEMRGEAWRHYVHRQTFDGFVAPAVPSTENWDFAYPNCAGAECVMTATGRPGRPVYDATVTVTLYTTGAASVTSTGF